MSDIAAERIEAAARIAKFCDEYAQLGGLHPEIVYALHRGHARECEVRISDLRALVAAVSPQPEYERLGFTCDTIHGAAGGDWRVFQKRQCDECKPVYLARGVSDGE